MSSKSEQTREKIMKAAIYIVNKQGVQHLTLEGVATQAGISKGGLLHHYGSKELLVKALLEYTTQGYYNDVRAYAEEENPRPGSWTRAMIKASACDELYQTDLNTGIAAALLTNPQLLSLTREHYEFMQQKLEQDGLDPVLATIIRLAVDGLWFAEMLHLAPLDAQMRAKVSEQLMQLTYLGNNEPEQE
ncbi:TetR family transcriptional regulator [Paenibacillus sp. UMB4589-SE434]|uniref:TetR family transcriptional regulator n=1 Tax=Paenibacillus sp. UMB4589-SE434 TaxID=3046314 RepID=UPI00255184C0|nr:TetR family transcriptional regulator [Paenibacillus sp. UMB4589-SE434]MDK8182906.1 TetR family transcriptional regulator [Paenibacillus sp. UMB4589-SE434]